MTEDNSNLRILSWNINGLGDTMGYREIHAITKSCDIVAFPETMKGAHFIQNFPGYQSFHFPRLTKHTYIPPERSRRRLQKQMWIYLQ